MKAVFKFFSRLVKYIRLDYRLRKAVRMADEMYRKDGNQYFVLPDKAGNLVILTFREFKRLRRVGKTSYAVKEDLLRECFYCTKWKKDAKLPLIAIREKRKMYFEYYMG